MRLKSYVISEGRGREITIDQAMTLIKTKCKKAMEYYTQHKKTILRGIPNGGDFIHIDPKTSERKSAHTENYYTLILDNDSRWKSYPKRSQSIVCSTSKDKTRLYGQAYRVFAYDGSRYGVCPMSDIWDSFRETTKSNLGTVNDSLSDLDVNCDTLLSHSKTYDDFIKQLSVMSGVLRTIDTEDDVEDYEREETRDTIMSNVLYKRWVAVTGKRVSFKEWFIDLYDPQKNGFFVTQDIGKIFTTGAKSKEIWTDGEAIMTNYYLDDKELIKSLNG